ncbi:CoA-disulfide reductase [Desulfitispora alkaliphila]|uniref:CoA-disulfide reductase n=1 Tax=Desulfitispora alkaliphila TaxID=622674 RepID=UPI003D1FD17F
MKVLIIGGVAGGASAAARLRRLKEDVEIVMFERGDYISFANCGLPYYIGGSINERKKLLVQTPAGMGKRFNMDIRTNSEVVKIKPEEKIVEVKNGKTGESYEEFYDYLILSPGANPVKPPIPGIDQDNIFSLRSLDDTDRIKAHIQTSHPQKGVVIGGGFIGLEMAENMADAGMEVTLVEAANQVMAPLDFEMAAIVHKHLREKGVKLFLNNSVKSLENSKVTLADGTQRDFDLAILAIGVQPESNLAKEAGLKLGNRGAVIVDSYLRTSNPYIYAVGDVIQVQDFVTKTDTYVPLAGPANRQGRIAANNIAGYMEAYKGTQGTSIAKVFDLTVATTGVNEKTLQILGIPYQVSITNNASHAGYYPGAVPMNVKLIFNERAEILGAQIVGVKGVDKRIDVLATAIRAGMTVYQLEDLELAYAPPYSSAKDPVNMAGFVASNILKGDVDVIHWHELHQVKNDPELFLLDVRTDKEYKDGRIEEALHIPIDQLRGKIDLIPKDKEILIICQTGLRSYIAARILNQRGYRTKNLSGGFNIYEKATSES